MKLASKIFNRNDWYVTSPFGTRTPIQTKNGITTSFHNGCDYGTNREKWEQYALENGKVLSCGVAVDGAKYIWINYPRINKKILHYHLDSICVKTGQDVYDGLLLGYTGSTGMATGIHLHLGMKSSDGETYEDPHSYDYQPNNIQEMVDNSESKESNEVKYYTVKKGDTLIKIAKKFGTNWKKIYDLNKDIIGNNPNLIVVGQILKI